MDGRANKMRQKSKEEILAHSPGSQMNERYFCPKCKSFDVKKDITASLAFGVPQNWICNNCGYSNMIFPTIKKSNQKNK